MRRGVNGVIPFAMELVLLQVHPPNFLIRHLPAGRVFPAIQTTSHLEPFGSRRARNQIHDRLIISKRLAAPIRGDEREQSVFHLVPFAGARWKVTDGNRKARFIRELLQLQFPEPQPWAVTAPAIGSDQQRPRQRIQGPAFATPPSSYGCDRECSRVMVRAHVHESGVARQIVDAIRISAGNIGRRKVVPVYFDRFLCGKPLLAAIIVVSEQFLLLGVHRYYRHPRRQGSLHLGVDMTELRIAVGMIRTFLRLPIALQTVVLIAQKLCHFLMTDRMLLSCQLSSQSPGALQIHRRGDSGSPRVSGSIRRSNETSSLGSRSTMFFRPAPDRRIRPGIAFPSAISRIPLAMAFRERPLARRILETPPYPKARASLAAISRRLRSSRSSHTLENFRRRDPSSFSIPKQEYLYSHLVATFIY